MTGVTVSAAQAARARARAATQGSLCIVQRDWLANGLAAERFDRAFAVESSEHMPDKQRFFDEAFRILKPGGLFAVCAWLRVPIRARGRFGICWSRSAARGACRAWATRRIIAGSPSARGSAWRAWRISATACGAPGGSARGAWLGSFATQPRYLRFLIDRRATNRVFAATLVRLMIAYRTGSMRYCLLVFRKQEA